MALASSSDQILRMKSLSLDTVLPSQGQSVNFAAFCGDPDQRGAVGLRGIERALDQCGIIVLDSDGLFGSLLMRAFDTYTGSVRLVDVTSPEGYNSSYDPLFGLSAHHVLDAILPNDKRDTEQTQLRARLQDYLSIIEYYGRQQQINETQLFNLDLLLDLTEMTYQELDRVLLSTMSEQLRDKLRRRLSKANVQQQVSDAVESFAAPFTTSRIWRRRSREAHSKSSLVSCIESGNVASLRLPGSNSELLDYISIEIDELISRSIPFLIVTSSICLEHTRLSSHFLDANAWKPWSCGILAQSPQEVFGPQNEGLSNVIAQYPYLFVFSCGTVTSARPFSDAIGEYQRHTVTTHRERFRLPFHLFASHSVGMNEVETPSARIPAEELERMGSGALVFGNGIPNPILAQRLSFGGRNNGIVLR